jgi:hypothetical protein
VKKELSVFGVQADDVGRQHIDGEIRRELRNLFFDVWLGTGSAIASYDVSTRSFFAAPARFCGA